jgi:hypothetical protein
MTHHFDTAQLWVFTGLLPDGRQRLWVSMPFTGSRLLGVFAFQGHPVTFAEVPAARGLWPQLGAAFPEDPPVLPTGGSGSKTRATGRSTFVPRVAIFESMAALRVLKGVPERDRAGVPEGAGPYVALYVDAIEERAARWLGYESSRPVAVDLQPPAGALLLPKRLAGRPSHGAWNEALVYVLEPSLSGRAERLRVDDPRARAHDLTQGPEPTGFERSSRPPPPEALALMGARAGALSRIRLRELAAPLALVREEPTSSGG